MEVVLTTVYLEPSGTKLYVPVEDPATGSSSNLSRTRPSDDRMLLDNSKYKVYIYNLDDELSSSESEPEDGKLVFLPDIEKHLKMNRIPPPVTANSDGELAGMQLVLYNVPSSLTVPEEHDSVRKAIIEARARAREKQRGEFEETRIPTPMPSRELADDAPTGSREDPDAMDLD